MPDWPPPPTLLCLASYEKGALFMREAKRQGASVILVTVPSLEHAEWPRQDIDELFYMPDLGDVASVINGVSYLARSRPITRVVALDEYDVATAAALREHLRLPGMNESATRFLRDKLAMRMRAAEHDIPVPAFSAAYNDQQVAAFLAQVPGPWLVKPRSEASTIGIGRMETAEQVWAHLHGLGDRRSFHLLERFVPGEIYHVDSIIAGGRVVFAEVGQYGRPPLDVFHSGGVALTRLVPADGADRLPLLSLNERALRALGAPDGITHLECIKAFADGTYVFLEAAARVGGAYISDMIEAATGLNLWQEWAKIETAPPNRPFALPALRHDCAGVLISLARMEHPDTSAYQDPEIVWRLNKPHHVGFLVASPDPARVWQLLDELSRRVTTDFGATLPPYTGKPPSTM